MGLIYDSNWNKSTEAEALGQSGVRRTRPLPDKLTAKLIAMLWPTNPWFGPDARIRQAQEDYALHFGKWYISGPDKEAVQAVAEAYLDGGEQSESEPTVSLAGLEALRRRIRELSYSPVLPPEGVDTKGFTFFNPDEVRASQALAEERVDEAKRHMAEYLTKVVREVAKSHRELEGAEAHRAMLTGEPPREIRLEVRWESQPSEKVEAYLTAEEPDPGSHTYPFPWGHPYRS